jgi:hypothetical protein
MKKIIGLGLAITIGFGIVPNGVNAKLTDRMPIESRRALYKHVCSLYKENTLSIDDMLKQTITWYLDNGNLGFIPENLSEQELKQVKYERQVLAIEQAHGMLDRAILDNSCRPTRSYY